MCLSRVDQRDGPTLFSADLTVCAAIPHLAPAAVASLFLGALERAGATIVSTLSHDFPGTGLTCVAILAESHAVLHTWPETGTVNVDIFSCTARLSGQAVIDELARTFGAAHIDIRETARADGHRDAPRTR